MSSGRRSGGWLPFTVAVLATAVAVVPAQAQQRPALELALVIPFSSAPLLDPSGRVAEDAAQRLAEAEGAAAALASPELEGLPLALAPSPVFCDEALHTDGPAAGRFVSAMRDLSTRVPVVSSPYAEVRLPHLGTSDAVRDQIDAGRAALAACLRTEPTSSLYPPDLSLDAHSLAGAGAAGVATALAPAELAEPRPVRARDVVLIPAFEVPPGDAPNDVVVRMGPARAAAAVIDPGRPDLSTFLSAIANDPRIVLRTLQEVATDPGARSVSFPSAASPPSSYRTALSAAGRALERLRSYTLEGERRVAILASAVGRAGSSAEWDARWEVGRDRAVRVVAAAERERRLVSATGDSVTFTSQQGSVPVTVTNATSYPVRVRVTLSSPKLSFPDGSNRVITVEPPGDTTVFAALSRSTGSFPVRVGVTSPDREIVFHSGEITLRSTAANLPALALTAGGAVFLMVWSVRDIRRRRRRRAGS